MFSIECHCQTLKLTANSNPESITSCNCSICNRLGALWAYYNLDEVKTQFEDEHVVTYSWGKKSIYYYRCTNCGCTTHYIGTEDNGSQWVAINCRMAPISEIKEIPVRKLDGLDTWEYLDE